ncbi:MAG: 5'-nucleotidase C-terminal domain-containing protein [Paludibacter sp.]|nr:5'-nucleotidase C-terminal domain-containing protein [Bacteroidales bacterium]MCM1069399.1 5'-nucleotidase C-terminal domain-containing protein [Prevotella sp.]MCM1353919.1 5'-nucleotidase C-terminal domain-containing protein [Bacteroides sp.]MCM1442831.1 5'-nucleotidase C-terminal domain-containing protein [Muribaculum sp.]MCM1481876.1 5'-nucleotidase C-terminal domain-containing protein [Paludibacter sp.]
MKRIYYLSFLLLIIVCVGCGHKPLHVSNATSISISIDSSLNALQDSDYLRYLQPIKEQLEAELDHPLGYAPEAMSAYKPESPLLNWASDALHDMAAQVQQKSVAFAVVNIGGLRCDWGAGDITFRNIFELMPFDNRLVILTLTGKDVLDLCQCFAESGGQGVSRTLRMEIKDGNAQNVTIAGKPVAADALYYVATSDYLSTGADHMEPLTRFTEKDDTQLRIRDLYINYVEQLTKAGKTVSSKTDNRMNIL